MQYIFLPLSNDDDDDVDDQKNNKQYTNERNV